MLRCPDNIPVSVFNKGKISMNHGLWSCTRLRWCFSVSHKTVCLKHTRSQFCSFKESFKKKKKKANGYRHIDVSLLLGETAPCWPPSAMQSPPGVSFQKLLTLPSESTFGVFCMWSRIAFFRKETPRGYLYRRSAVSITHNVSSRYGKTEETTLEK